MIEEVEVKTLRITGIEYLKDSSFGQDDFDKECLIQLKKAFKHLPKDIIDEFADIERTKNSQQESDQSILDVSNQQNKSINKGSQNGTQEKKDKGGIKKVIDYRRSYSIIGLNVHLINLMSGSLKTNETAYNSYLCRSTFLMHTMRIFMYQVILISTQFAAVLAFVCLMSLEVSKVILTITLYCKKRHYRYIILFLLDISQSIFLFIFLCMCYPTVSRSSPLRTKEVYETVSIYCIVISCTIEYILLLSFVYISVAQNRKISRTTKLTKPYMKIHESSMSVHVKMRDTTSEDLFDGSFDDSWNRKEDEFKSQGQKNRRGDESLNRIKRRGTLNNVESKNKSDIGNRVHD